MEHLNAIVVDDEVLARRRVCDLLDQIETIKVLEECHTGKSAISKINSLKPDIVFLDVNLTDMNGFEILQGINFEPKPVVIFTTAHHQFAKDAFDYEAFDFLLKPFEDERFFRTINKVLKSGIDRSDEYFHSKISELVQESGLQAYHKQQNLLPVRQGNKTALVEVNKVRYVIASGYYAEVFTKAKKHVIRESLSNLIDILDDDLFYRVSRSAIINLKCVEEIIHSNYSEIDVKMKGGKLIRVSKNHKKDFLKKIGC